MSPAKKIRKPTVRKASSSFASTSEGRKQEPPKLKLYLEPQFGGVDKGDGGIRRVVEAQRKHLDVEFVDSPEQADVVASHVAPLKPTLHFLKANPHVPFVVQNHGCYWAEYDWHSWEAQVNADVMEAVRLADGVIACSEWVAQSLRRNSLRKVAVIGHGVDLEDWPEGQEDGKYVLWNKTRLDPVCDPEPLVRLAELAPEVRFKTTLWPENVPAPGNVMVTGRLPYEEAKKDVQHASVYLCTTRETMGIGTLEAMAAGSPILGWNWGGQAEFVKHRETGWLAPVGDYASLAEGLEWCLANREAVGAAARADIVARFQWKDVVPQYLDVFRRVRGEKPRLEPTRNLLVSYERPVVSVIVPAHGLEAFLPEALDSVKAQTFANWECVIVDDASQDRCGEIADAYALEDARFRVVHNEKNEYLAGSLNIGIAESKGQYVLPFDADNVLMPETLETLVQQLDGDRSIDIAYGSVKFIREDGTPDESVGPGGLSGWPMEFKTDWQMIGRNMIPSTSLYRRRVWELTGGYRRRWRTAEDADFWSRAASYGLAAKMVTTAVTLVYRNREGSMSRLNPAPDWSAWLPWSRGGTTPPPAAAVIEPQPPIPSLEPVLVSVVIPVGPGHEELLIDALDSVDAQTFRLWECIVVNDSGRPLRWLPSWARYAETASPGSGPANARNVGVAMARGKLFLPLDADDTLEAPALALMYQTQQQFGGYVYCDWNERTAGKSTVWQTPEYDALLLTQHGCLHAVTGLYPVAAWKAVGGFDPEVPGWEDWDFELSLANAEVCGTRYPQPLFTYRKDTGMRRDQNLADFEQSKQGILAKWKDYFDGKAELMGCRSCGGGGGGRVTLAPVAQNGAAAAKSEEMVLVEYLGIREGAVMYRAPSGQQYRFDSLPSDRVKMVRAEDVEFFLSFPNEFRVKEGSAV